MKKFLLMLLSLSLTAILTQPGPLAAASSNSYQDLGTLVGISTLDSATNKSRPPGSGTGPTTYYVDAVQGNDRNKGTSIDSPWKSLNKVNKSSFLPSDKILFKRDQSWVGKLVIPSSGSKTGMITLGDYGTGNKPIIKADNINYVVLLNKKNFITLQNLEITNPNGQGLIITASTDNGLITIDSCDIRNNLKNGITIQDRGNTMIINCKIYSNEYNGISVYYSIDTGSWGDLKGDNMKILNNEIHDNGRHGIYLAGDNAIIQHNTIYANGSQNLSHNMYLMGDNSLVENNTFKDAANIGFRYEGSNMIFRYNFLKANHKHNLSFWNDFPDAMSNNKVYYNIFVVKKLTDATSLTSMAIFVGKSGNAGNFDGIDFYNNSIYASDDDAGGMWLFGCDNINVKNNIFKIGNGYLIYKDIPAIKLSSDYNIFASTERLPLYAEDSDINFTDWQALGQDQHSFFTDPMFVSSAPEIDSDFALAVNSPAIRAGINLSLTKDYKGNPVADMPDIGALQYIN
jgi:parallel beta-helix repeat protein